MQKQEPLFTRQRRHRFARIALFGAPFLLCLIELGHPILDTNNTFRMLGPIVVWWIIMHILIAPLFGLMGWAMWLMLEGIRGPLAWISRTAACTFSVFSIGYEFAIGLVSGVVTKNAEGLPVAQLQVIQQSLTRLLLSPIFDRLALFIILVGLVAVLTAALALWRAGAPRWPLLVFLGSLFFVRAHESPFGPFGNLCFFIAALWLELSWDLTAQPKADKIKADRRKNPSVSTTQEASAVS